jgi:hypothetical protein
MQIIIENEQNAVQQYKFNFDELHGALMLHIEKYKNLAVSEDSIQEGKATRADLNKLKKELSDKVIEIKKKHMLPFDEFKAQTDKLIAPINEVIQAIDKQIKEHEQKLRDEKKQKIIELWHLLELANIPIPFEKIFKIQWLNKDFSMKKIQVEMEEFFNRAMADIHVIKSFNSEFELEILEVYSQNYNMSEAMAKKANLEARKAAQIERERQEKERLERLEAQRIAREEAEAERKQQEEQARKEAEFAKEAALVGGIEEEHFEQIKEEHSEVLIYGKTLEQLEESDRILPFNLKEEPQEAPKENTTFILTLNQSEKELVIQFFNDNGIEYYTM